MFVHHVSEEKLIRTCQFLWLWWLFVGPSGIYTTELAEPHNTSLLAFFLLLCSIFLNDFPPHLAERSREGKGREGTDRRMKECYIK